MREEEAREILKQRVEKLMSNRAFLRFARSFLVYQEIYGSTDSIKKKKEMRQKMGDVFNGIFFGTVIDREELCTNLAEFFRELFIECEKGQFDTKKLAEKLALSSFYERFDSEWNSKPEVSEHDEQINELVLYTKHPDYPIMIHIKPANLDTKDFVPKLVEGFRIIAGKMKSGEIDESYKDVVMKSWLLSGKFWDEIKKIFGDTVKGYLSLGKEDTKPEDVNVALIYNRKSLEEYLKSGEVPLIGIITLTREQFLERFGSVNPL